MKERRKKILLIGPYPPPEGGVSVHIQRLLQRSVSNEGIELAVCDLKRGLFIDENENLHGLFSAFRFFLSSDTVHLHLSHPLKSVIGRIVKLSGKKLIYTQHNPREESVKSTEKIIRLSDKVIFVYKNADEKDRLVIPAFIPPKKLTALPEELSKLFNGRKVMVTMSSAAKTNLPENDLYGFDIVLSSLNKISSAEKLLMLFVDVNGVFEKKYAPLILKLQKELGDRILLRYISGSIDFPALLSKADIFIRATLTDGDSIAIREALSLGARVVASDCVERPDGCLIFKSRDAVDLALKISEALKAGRLVFEQDDNSDKLFGLYLSL